MTFLSVLKLQKWILKQIYFTTSRIFNIRECYRKNHKISDTPKFAVITLKVEQDGFSLEKDAEGIANSVDPDQTAPLGAVWSGSALFAQTCLSENLGTLRYKL